MKVLLPVIDNKSRKNNIADGFRNAGFVCIYDDQFKSKEWKSVDEICEIPGELIPALVRNGVYSVIGLNITPMVLTMFKRSKIEVYKAQSADVSENLGLLLGNKLKSFTKEESTQTTSCNSNSCSSCGSTCN